MIPIEEAQKIVLADVGPLPAEEAPLLDAVGGVCAEEVRAPWDIPLSDCSATDGYAFSAASPGETLRVEGFRPAGTVRTAEVPPGARLSGGRRRGGPAPGPGLRDEGVRP